MVTRFPLTVANEFAGMREAMDRFFQDASSASSPRLAMDVFVNENAAVVTSAIPGIEPETLEITVEQSTVTISGEIPSAAASEDATNATWYLQELPRGAFRRTLTVPFEIDTDAAEATFEHGMLRLRLPKVEVARSRQIKVTAGGAKPVAATAINGETESTS